MVEFRILRGGRSAKSRTTTLDFRIAVFSFFRDVLGRIPRDMALERRGIWKSNLIPKVHILQAQEKSILTSRKSSKGDRRPAWISKELLTELRHKKEAYKRWTKRQMTQKYRVAV